MHLISNNKSFSETIIFYAFLSHIGKKKKSDGNFLPFLPGGQIHLKDKARFNHSYIADD